MDLNTLKQLVINSLAEETSGANYCMIRSIRHLEMQTFFSLPILPE